MIRIEGLKGVIRSIEKRGEKIMMAIDADLTEGAELIEGRAKLLAPVDRGKLRATIVADTKTLFEKTVTDNSFYAPYMEFGTKRNYNGQRPEIARQFKGKREGGGDYFDFLNNLLDWVMRKKIFGKAKNAKPGTRNSRKQELIAAQAIADSIMRYGVKAANNGTGFFFRAYDELLPTIISNIKKTFKRQI